MNDDLVQDPLKPLNEIYEADARQKYFSGNLDDLHFILSEIKLNETVPVDVRQLFETAKNVSLYSWFVYRFNPVANLVGFSALEMGLRERYLADNPDANIKNKGLHWFLKYAKNQKWIENNRFKSLDVLARSNAEHKKFQEIISSGILENIDSVEVPEPSQAEIDQAMDELNPVDGIVNNAAKIRNDLAHGSKMLIPHSFASLRNVAEVLNQIFD